MCCQLKDYDVNCTAANPHATVMSQYVHKYIESVVFFRPNMCCHDGSVPCHSGEYECTVCEREISLHLAF